MPQAPPVRRARVAVAALFFTNGAVFANLIPRYPQLKAELGLTNAGLGGALAAFPAGALCAGLFAALLIRRWGSARVAAWGMVGLGGALGLVGLVPGWGALAGVLLVAGGTDAVVDVAQNAHGLRVQRRYDRSIINSFHATWSIGGVTGGLMGSAAAGVGLPLDVHLGASAVLFGVVAAVAYRFVLTGAEDAERADDGAREAALDAAPPGGLRRVAPGGPVLVIAGLGVLAASGAVVEDAASSWAALFMTSVVGAGAAIAGFAFVCFQAAMTAGRLLGDRVVDRFGQRAVARAGGAVAAAGMSVALLAPSAPTGLGGFALAGLGVATLVPAAMRAADEAPGVPRGVGLTVVSWLLRVGLLVSPPVVGAVADLTSLRVGLLSVVVAGIVILALSRILGGRGSGPVRR